MFKGEHTPCNLLCASHVNLDMAFIQAVRLASAWLGPEVMPAVYLSAWPPTSSHALSV